MLDQCIHLSNQASYPTGYVMKIEVYLVEFTIIYVLKTYILEILLQLVLLKVIFGDRCVCLDPQIIFKKQQ